MKYLHLVFLILCISIIACKPIVDLPIENPNNKLKFTLQHSIETPKGLPQGIVISDDKRFLFLAEKEGGLTIYEKDVNNYQLIKNFSVKEFDNLEVMHLDKQGDFIYLALGSFFGRKSKSGLAIVDISNPENAVISDTWASATIQKGSAIVRVQDNFAYLGVMDQGVYVFDVSNKQNIEKVSEYRPDINFPTPNPNKIQHPNARGMDIVGNSMYLCYDAGGIRIIDISDKANLKEIGRYINNEQGMKQQAYNNIVVANNMAYVAIDYCGMEVLDISDPSDIKQLDWWNPWKCNTSSNTWFNSAGHTNQISYNEAEKLVFLSSGKSELNVIDVSNSNKVSEIASYGNINNKKSTWGMSTSENEVYLLYIKTFVPFQTDWSGIKILEWSPN